MERLIEEKLVQWKENKYRKPLLLLGARQVGKTFIIKEFAKKKFPRYHYFDFEELKHEIALVFDNTSIKPKNIIDKLSFVAGDPIDVETDLLIFDETQAVPRAITSLKYFYEKMPQLALIAAGSNLGVTLSDSPFPVGKVECLTLYPMNFEEFLLGLGEDIAYNYIKNHPKNESDEFYHNKLFVLLLQYFVVGGMPESIKVFSEHRKEGLQAYRNVRETQKQLLLHYERDFSKYAGVTNSRHIERIFSSIPSQLSQMHEKHVKKFKFKDVISKGFRRYEDLADPIDWLVKAGLTLKVNLIEHPLTPLQSGTKENSFKLYFFDIGLLGAINRLLPETILNYDYGSYKGYFAENFVLQELYSYELQTVVTWLGRTSEIEFVIEIDGVNVPVEVKAGTNTKAKSLLTYINKYHPEYAIKFSGKKFSVNNKLSVINVPLYQILQINNISHIITTARS